MVSYSQFLPQGALGTSSVPFFMPQICIPVDRISYFEGTSLSTFDDADVETIYTNLNTGASNLETTLAARGAQSTITITGSGLLTHVLTAKTSATTDLVYRITVDGEDTYEFVFGGSVNSRGILGGFQYGIADSTPATGADVTNTSASNSLVNNSTYKAILLSPQNAAFQGIGIPFDSSISLTLVSGTTYSSGDGAKALMFGQRYRGRKAL